MLQASDQTLGKSLKMLPHVAHFWVVLSSSRKWKRLMHLDHLSAPIKQSVLKISYHMVTCKWWSIIDAENHWPLTNINPVSSEINTQIMSRLAIGQHQKYQQADSDHRANRQCRSILNRLDSTGKLTPHQILKIYRPYILTFPALGFGGCCVLKSYQKYWNSENKILGGNILGWQYHRLVRK